MNTIYLLAAAVALGHQEPISVEPDGTIWVGTSENRKDLTNNELDAVQKKVKELANEKAAAKQAVLDRLGITADEAALILG
jgi:hypothetical protein